MFLVGCRPSVRRGGALDELDAAASAVSVRRPSAARRARSVGERMVGICVLSVRSLLGCSWGSAVGNICRRCLLPGLSWLLSVSSWKLTRRAAEGGVQLWYRAPAGPLDPLRCFGV